jgi:hypothetical protein
MAAATSYAGANRRLARPSPLFVGFVLLGAAVVAFVTLCPIGLRPHLATANEERFGAYFILGALIALAARRRGLAATAFVVVLAFGLEAAQLLTPGRDAAVSDAMVKALGGVFGSAAGQLIFPLRRLIAARGQRARLQTHIPKAAPASSQIATTTAAAT